MNLALHGKVAFVTGGSGAIGTAIALELAREGAHVAIAGRRLGSLYAAADGMRLELNGSGGRIMPATVDTSDMSSIRAALALADDAFGSLDILVNGATQSGGLAQDDDAAAADYLCCCLAAAPYMQRTGWGRILNVSGVDPASMRHLALDNLTRALSVELVARDITVNLLHCRPARYCPIGLGYLAAFLASPRATSITGASIGCGCGHQKVENSFV